MTKDVINRTDGLRRQAQEIIEVAYNRGYADGEADERARHKEPKEDELKPCPFCGGHASVMGVPRTDCSMEYIVQCGRCLATTPEYGDGEEAAEAWNRRASDVNSDKGHGDAGRLRAL